MEKRKPLTHKRSVTLPDNVYENICKIAEQKKCTPAVLMRNLITSGLAVSWVESSESLVRRIVHDEVDTVIKHEIERLIKLQLKSTKASAASLYALLVLIQSDYAGESALEDLLAQAFKQAASYMRTKEKTNDEYFAEARAFIKASAEIGKKDDT